MLQKEKERGAGELRIGGSGLSCRLRPPQPALTLVATVVNIFRITTSSVGNTRSTAHARVPALSEPRLKESKSMVWRVLEMHGQISGLG